jgi:hypothetical protein
VPLSLPLVCFADARSTAIATSGLANHAASLSADNVGWFVEREGVVTLGGMAAIVALSAVLTAGVVTAVVVEALGRPRQTLVTRP